MRVFTSPQPFAEMLMPNRTSIFLAGSIDMGEAIDWQKDFCRDFESYDIDILNPRREVWDKNWVQSNENKLFREQVEWELQGLEAASMVVMYFAPNSTAPVSLIEFGLYARSKKLVVFCAPDFWKKGNIEIVCQQYNVPYFTEENNLIDYIKSRLG